MPQAGVELFDEFFESGMEESVSPFLKPSSRRWGKNLHLKSSLLAAFLLIFTFVSHFLGHPTISNLLLLFTFFFAGIPALIASIEDILTFEINIDVLMTLAAFLSVLIGSGREGALLLVLFSFSGAVEESVRFKARGALSALRKLAPSKAFVLQEDGSLIEKSIKDIDIGSAILVKSGQVVPLDGIVIAGISSVNLVHLTGEATPLQKKIGDEVPAGARNLEGSLTLKITNRSSDSTLSKIINLITEAQEAKPKFQRWLDRISHGYALSIIGLALLFALTLPLLFSMPFLGHEGSIYRALAFLIAASPCALIIAIPIAYLSAVSACAKKGILLKGGIILDSLVCCTKIAMDKTGTITTGELSCLGITSFGKLPVETVIALAYGLEQNAVHPIASSIGRYARGQNIAPLPIENFQVVPGFGLLGTYQDLPVYAGNESYILPKLPNTSAQPVQQAIEKARAGGEVLMLLSFKDELYLFRFKDELRPCIKQTIESLNSEFNMSTTMLTGDHGPSAKKIAEEVGISSYYSDLRPEDKLSHITKLVERDNLIMVGDGINDAPALARATVGISMGKVGSTTAVDASDIVFLQDNIESLVWLLRKARMTRRVVRQNLILASLAIVVAAGPALLGWVPLWLAVILHEGGTVLVGMNGLRLLKR